MKPETVRKHAKIKLESALRKFNDGKTWTTGRLTRRPKNAHPSYCAVGGISSTYNIKPDTPAAVAVCTLADTLPKADWRMPRNKTSYDSSDRIDITNAVRTITTFNDSKSSFSPVEEKFNEAIKNLED